MPGAAQSGGTTAECSLDEPLWYWTAGTTETLAGSWDTGRRLDPICEFVAAAWSGGAWVSSAPVERPDGLSAPSVGAVFAASGGIMIRRGVVELRAMPEIAWHENSNVAIPDSPYEDDRRFGYQWAPIDWPFRFGSEPFAAVGPGRSGSRVHVSNLSIGVDAEPVRWGPSRRYPLLLSGHQGSLPRIGFRTERPWDIAAFGTLDANLLYARLTGSDWFADSSAPEARIMAGFTLGWAPALFPGLGVGFSTLHHQDAADFGLGSAFEFLQSAAEDPEDNSTGNGLGNFWLSWSRPESGFEVWLEWMKDDFNRDFTHLLLEPEKGSARTVGFRQEVEMGDDAAMSVHLEATRTRNARPSTTDDDGERGITYTHREVREGHTHRGQLLGAIVGPGGDGQFFELIYRDGVGSRTTRTALQLERLRFNTDAYTDVLGQPLGDEGYDVEVVGRVLHERRVGSIRARGSVEMGGRHNRLFLQENDPSWEANLRVEVMLLWRR